MTKSPVLIGMPGAGKSTIGVQLAKELSKDFVDTDILIQNQQGKSLQQIMDETDHLNLRKIEAQTIQATHFHNQVIATGGSVIYDPKTMHHLSKIGPIIYLETDLNELKKRIHNYETRGIAKHPQQTFQEVFEERTHLYQKYADLTINGNNTNEAKLLQTLIERLPAYL